MAAQIAAVAIGGVAAVVVLVAVWSIARVVVSEFHDEETVSQIEEISRLTDTIREIRTERQHDRPTKCSTTTRNVPAKCGDT